MSILAIQMITLLREKGSKAKPESGIAESGVRVDSAAATLTPALAICSAKLCQEPHNTTTRRHPWPRGSSAAASLCPSWHPSWATAGNWYMDCTQQTIMNMAFYFNLLSYSNMMTNFMFNFLFPIAQELEEFVLIICLFKI